MRVNITPARSLLVARDAPFTQLQRVFFLLLALMWKCMMFESWKEIRKSSSKEHTCLNPISIKKYYYKNYVFTQYYTNVFTQKLSSKQEQKYVDIDIYRMTLDSAMSCFYSVGKEKLKLLNLYLIFSVTNFPRDPKLTNVWLVFVKKVYQKKFMRNLRA